MLLWDRTALSYLRSKEVGVVDGTGALTRHFTVRRPNVRIAESADRVGRVWIAWADVRGGRAGVAQLLPTGRAGTTQWLQAPGIRTDHVAISASADGAAIATWTAPAGSKTRVFIALRRPGQRFGQPRVLGVTDAPYLNGTIGGGHWLVAGVTEGPPMSAKNGAVVTWTGALRGATPTRRQVFRPAPPTSEMTTEVDGRGRSWLLWRSQPADEEEARPFNLRAASISPRGRPRGPRVIASGLGWGSGVPRLAASPIGGATVLTGIDHGPDHPSQMRIITADADGTWRPPSAPLLNPGVTGGVTYDADGTALVTWDSLGDSDANPPSAYAALVDPTGNPRSPELIGIGDATVGWFGTDRRPRTAAIAELSHRSTIDIHIRSSRLAQ